MANPELTQTKEIFFDLTLIFKSGVIRVVSGSFLTGEDLPFNKEIHSLEYAVQNGGPFTWNPPSTPNKSRSFAVNPESLDYYHLQLSDGEKIG